MSETPKSAVLMDTEWAKQVKDFNNAQDDWYGTCTKCGAYVTGTPKQLREHDCGEKG